LDHRLGPDADRIDEREHGASQLAVSGG
jgi:hypothetical protein